MLRQRRISIIIVLGMVLLSGTALMLATAQAASPTPLIPCSGIPGFQTSGDPGGLPGCTSCHFFKLIGNIIDFVSKYLIPPAAVILLSYAGLLYMLSGAVDQKAQAKSLLISTILGVVLAYSAFIILFTFLSVIAGDKVTSIFKITATGFEISCGISQAPPPPLAACTGGSTIVDGVDVCAGDTKTFLDDSIRNPEGVSLKTERSGVCAPLGGLAPYITAASAETGIPPERIKAIIAKESGGLAIATSRDNDGGSSYGVMQVRPETARSVMPELSGKSDQEVKAWLFLPENSIKAGSRYYAGLFSKYRSHDLASAAYNGGPVANYDSVNCSGMKRWQCPWDSSGCWGTAESSCTLNERAGHPGYGVTRRYVPGVKDLEAQYKSGACS